ncbi:MAG TPA: hypothetical protein EYG02_11930 [Henriciella marina]|uniref:COG4223 family protein n=1 Tax=Henriciella sp. TaxID=1968823 RepID=UPI0017EE9E0F|nr:hypothetical protein [Henriciella sp.]HIG24060.1 hypothetical protein [Henriciella sp.]HIK65724.1 hypothetical protein [Henriciella marina]
MSDPQTPTTDPIDAEFEPAENEAAQESPTEETPARKTSSRGPGWLSLLFVMLIAFGALGLSLWSSGLLQKGLQPDDTATDLAALTDRQTDLASRIDALEERLSDVTAQLDGLSGTVDALRSATPETDPPAQGSVVDEDAIADLSARIDAVEEEMANQPNRSTSIDPQRITNLEAALQTLDSESAPTSAELASLRQEVSSLRSRIQQLASAQSALEETSAQTATQADAARRSATTAAQSALAIASIENAITTGTDFRPSAQRLQELQPASEAAAMLARLSANPVPSLATLQTRFDALKNDALDRDSEAAGEPGWVDTFFGDMVSVRRGGGNSVVPAILSAAEAAIERGELQQAVSALEGLPAESLAVYAGWLTDARNRIDARKAIDALRLEFAAQTP